MYLIVYSRPDIVHVVNVLSEFNNSYTQEYWVTVTNVLRNLKGTLDYRFEHKQTGIYLRRYVDANCAGNDIDRKSYTALVDSVQ